jgi:CheY-like chemotaxis protein
MGAAARNTVNLICNNSSIELSLYLFTKQNSIMQKPINYSPKLLEPLWVEHGYGTRFQGFQNLMRYRIRNILLVSSLYDLYVFEEDGRLYELIRHEYQGLNLSHSPEITRVSGGQEAIAIAKEEKRFDLIITTQHIEDMHAARLAELVRESDLNIPVILLAYDNRELSELVSHTDTSVFDKIFIWTGNFRIIIAIIKYLEDKVNVDHDSRIVGVQSIILIEDNVRFYSSFLPILYTEILEQSQRLISEGINLSHKFLRMRARPKILLCSTYEEAWEVFTNYEQYILGIISDIDFMRNGKQDPYAGIEFAGNVTKKHGDISILLQSNNQDMKKEAEDLGVAFALKDSPTLLQEVRKFTIENFGFGDFIMRSESGIEVGRAFNLQSLEQQLALVPEESIKYHAERNHFSNWLKARTEFWLAHKLRPRKVTDFDTIEELRQDLISSLRDYRKLRQRGIITDFKKESFDPQSGFARIGGGSLGGKARGLSFVSTLINNYQIQDQYEDVRIYIPPAVVLGTDVFDAFVDENNLRDFALNATDDIEITQRFLESKKFPEEILGDLAAFLDLISEPLAVRSSSLLEDSQYHPFAGVYETYFLPNQHENPLIRLSHVLDAIKRVYASTFYQGAKTYIKVTSYRLEEEKMAVIIQKMVGTEHDRKFYPDFSGVAKSYNFYPIPPQKSSDGTVAVALGLGKTVVDGGNTVKFSPVHPNHLPQFFSVKETMRNNQKHYYALDLYSTEQNIEETHDVLIKQYTLDQAEKDGSLFYVGSTYSHENHVIYDGLSRSGPRLVTFAPILKHKIFPLPQILELLLEMGSWGMGTPIEIEFAVRMSVQKNEPKEFGLLQMRPLVLKREIEELKIEVANKDQLLCESPWVLGHGVLKDIKDIVYVDYYTFERSKSKEVAREVSMFNSTLLSEKIPYLLIGVGRWGTLDPWLGIPVNWDQISGARAIVESSFKDFMVTPSQGSHFFQNLTSFMISYFTVNSFKNEGFVDWDWLHEQPDADEKKYTKHIRLENPLTIKMNGQQNKGIILKPNTIDGEFKKRKK